MSLARNSVTQIVSDKAHAYSFFWQCYAWYGICKIATGFKLFGQAASYKEFHEVKIIPWQILPACVFLNLGFFHACMVTQIHKLRGIKRCGCMTHRRQLRIGHAQNRQNAWKLFGPLVPLLFCPVHSLANYLSTPSWVLRCCEDTACFVALAWVCLDCQHHWTITRGLLKCSFFSQSFNAQACGPQHVILLREFTAAAVHSSCRVLWTQSPQKPQSLLWRSR